MGRSSDARRVDPAVQAMTGAAAPPRRNGEHVFEAPWQGRVFGLALSVVRALGLQWSDFQRHLIAAIADVPDRPYYESWVEALERLVREQGRASETELARAADAVKRSTATRS
jgi:nitrile hydratase accessory protein